MWNDEFTDMRNEVCAALRDEELTTGASVEWKLPMILAGNIAHDDPALSPVLVDDYGRFWKERHHNDSHSLVCILDTRKMGFIPLLGSVR